MYSAFFQNFYYKIKTLKKGLKDAVCDATAVKSVIQ
ncbi:MAG: hypothetical protein JWQ40_595 [Segetibacter sp.]|nr:hypothetical protein [Segetibacter sp.]